MSELIKKSIIAQYENFPQGEKKVAKYVVDNYDMITALSSIELSELSGVSDTTVVRFAKTLGFKGFLSFKNKLKAEQNTYRSPYQSLKKMSENPEHTSTYNYLTSMTNDINLFIASLEINKIDKLADSILEAEIVYLLGIGSDKVMVNYLNNYLPIAGIHCIPITDEGLSMREALLSLRQSDLVIMSSFPTVQKDEYWAATYTNDVGAPLALLTDSEITAKSLGAKNYIKTKTTMETFFNSSVLSMILCDVLLLKLHERAPDRVETTLKRYHMLTNM